MENLAARRRYLMRRNTFGNSTRFPTVSFRKQEYSKSCPISRKPRPKTECIKTSMIRRDLRRIGNSLDQLRINVEIEHNEITEEFEKKLLDTSSSICASITDIRQRLDTMTSLIGGNFQDSGLSETKSIGDLNQRNIYDSSLEEGASPAVSPISLASTVSNLSPKERSFSLHHVGAMTSTPNDSLVSDTRQYLKQRKSRTERYIDDSLFNGEKEIPVTDYRTRFCPSQKAASLHQFETSTMKSPESPILKYRPSLSQEIKPYDSLDLKSPITHRNIPNNYGNPLRSIKSHDSGIDTDDFKERKTDLSRSLGGINVPYGRYRKWQRSTGNRYLGLLKKAYCNWVPESTVDDSEGAHGTALPWKSHNIHNPLHYQENSEVKVSLPTRYPEWLFPDYYSRKCDDNDEYPDVFEDDTDKPSVNSMSLLLSEELKFPGPGEDRRWLVSRTMWEGWCLPGLSGEVEKELLKSIKANRSFREDLVRSHNSLRGSHGSPDLQEVDDLSRDAQMWADIIAEKGFMQYSELPGRGENIVFLETNGKELNGNDVTKLWYGEQSRFDFSDPKWRKETMNFSQMIWKSSTDIGIGVAKLKHQDKCVVVAHYRPVGNGNRSGEFRKNVLPPQ